jgi:hypothetical protein
VKRAALAIAWAIATLALGGACKHAEQQEESAPPEAPSAPPSASAKPNDQLAPVELIVGPDKALGIALPRGTRIEQAFADTVFATSIGKLGPCISYFRARVRGGTFTKGQYTATFEHVQVPGRPGRELRIRLREIAGIGTKLELFDSTPPETPDLPTEEERMRAGGLTKDGRLLDPKHME